MSAWGKASRPSWSGSKVAWLSGKFYDLFMGGVEHRCLVSWRKELLSDLSGDVLEVGAGTGANIEMYPDAVRNLTVIEPDPNMRTLLDKRISDAGRTVQVFKAFLEALPCEDNAFDAVVGTLVLCSVRDMDLALAEVKRVLRPGGTFVFLEHVAAEPTTKAAKVQNFLNPAWRSFAGGCNLNRTTEAELRRAGFEILTVDHDHLCAPARPLWPTIRGIARLPQQSVG